MKFNLVVRVLVLISFRVLSQTATDFFSSAEIKLNSDDYSGAISDFTKAIELDQLYVRAYGGRAVSHASL